VDEHDSLGGGFRAGLEQARANAVDDKLALARRGG
jgi:hypothetical protein